MKEEEKKKALQKRLKEYALRIIRLYEFLPKMARFTLYPINFYDQELRLGRSIERLAGLNQTRILSVKLKVVCKNWMKAFIG